ncbi:MAG: GAF domain-containing protein [Verrucomicrobia bacterium]|nr:GAF domain-containing protein [Verrucomicrobiota bacterium]
MKEALRRLRENKSQSLKRAADLLIEEAVQLTGSQIGYFAVLNKWEHLLTMVAWSKGAMAMCAVVDKPIVYLVENTGLWGDCVRERKAVITNDYKNSTRPTKKGTPVGHVPVKRHMNVPVMAGHSIKGILGVGNKETDYREEDAALLRTFADAAWPIIEQAKAREEKRSKCPLQQECPFYDRRIPIHDVMHRAYLQRFCEGGNDECAIFQVVQKIGFAKVPKDLYPNQAFRIEGLLKP